MYIDTKENIYMYTRIYIILGLALFALFVDYTFRMPSDCIHSVIYVQRTVTDTSCYSHR